MSTLQPAAADVEPVEPVEQLEPVEPAEPDWQRLSVGMLFVQPVRELIRAFPFLIALVFAGHASTSQPPWSLIGVAVVVAVGVARWLTTRYRITGSAVEVRRGLIARKRLTVPRDRVRTVDVSAHPLQRVLGLVKVEIGTGTSDRKAAALALDGLPASRAAGCAPSSCTAGTSTRTEPRTSRSSRTSSSASTPRGSATHRPPCPAP